VVVAAGYFEALSQMIADRTGPIHPGEVLVGLSHILRRSEMARSSILESPELVKWVVGSLKAADGQTSLAAAMVVGHALQTEAAVDVVVAAGAVESLQSMLLSHEVFSNADTLNGFKVIKEVTDMLSTVVSVGRHVDAVVEAELVPVLGFLASELFEMVLDPPVDPDDVDPEVIANEAKMALMMVSNTLAWIALDLKHLPSVITADCSHRAATAMGAIGGLHRDDGSYPVISVFGGPPPADQLKQVLIPHPEAAGMFKFAAPAEATAAASKPPGPTTRTAKKARAGVCT